MPTTANYSWPTPADTDLVKDGAEAIRDLGNAIDTTVFANSPGLVHIETQTPSAVSAVSFNNVFSATYKNYLIKINATTSSVVLRFRLRVSGSDNTANNYIYQTIRGASSTVSADTGTETSGYAIGVNSTAPRVSIDVFSPFETVETTLLSRIAANSTTSSLDLIRHTVSNSFDGITIFPQSGNITGAISIYGYKE